MAGHEVRSAHSGPDALEAAAAFSPHAVLLDIGLPGLSGYEVARRLRDNPRLAGAALIAVSGYGQDEDRHRSKEAGFDRHLLKPLDFGELQKLLATVAGAR
jgi:two-component system CheB/CheR fusion protein